MLYFIQPQLSHISGGTLYNSKIIQRLQEEQRGKEYIHPLENAVGNLILQFERWSNDAQLVIDALYLTASEFNASLSRFIPYLDRIWLMTHYLESMNVYYSDQTKEQLWKVERQWLQAVQGVIVSSNQLREYLSQRNINVDKITVACPGIEQASHVNRHPLKTLGFNDTITVITVGTLCPRKGQLELVKCLSQIQSRKVRLYLIGDCQQHADYVNEIRNWVEQSQMTAWVTLQGNLEQHKVFEMLSQCDLYVSLSTYESYSMAVAEAIAHGRPVVAYATGAIGDWIDDGVNGLLFDVGEQEKVQLSLERLLTHPHHLNELKKNALQKVNELSFYNWGETYNFFCQGLGL